MIISDFEQLKPFRHKQGIYLFTDKENPTKHYVGKAKNLFKRIAQDHQNSTGKYYIDYVIKKYGLLKKFQIELIHWWDTPTNNLEVLALEAAVIDAYSCLTKQGGYNICLFGNDRTGISLSDEHKRKIGLKSKNRHPTLETRNKISKSLKGYVHKPMPQERKEQQSKIMKSRFTDKTNHPFYDHSIYTLKHRLTNELFEGTRCEFYTKFNLCPQNVSRVLSGKEKSIKQWILIPHLIDYQI